MRCVTLVHHRVASYPAWREVYDSVRQVQKDGGVREHAVLRPADDPNVVIVLHAFDSAADAHAFFSNEQLKEAMVKAGVELPTMQLEFLDEEVAGAL